MLDQQSGSLRGTQLGPLHMCDNPVAWSLIKASNSESRTVPWCLAGIWQPGTHARLPDPASGEAWSCLNLMYLVVQANGRPVFF